MKQLLHTIFLILIISQSLNAQVKFLMEKNAYTGKYSISMLPEKTWRPPMNITATAQVTIKATAGALEIGELQSYQEDVEWVYGGSVLSPVESPGYDYHFFNLGGDGFVELTYKSFAPTKLFWFKAKSNCVPEIMLVSNYEDPFRPPNSKKINIGNSIGALGAGGEAYSGNLSDLPIVCNRGVFSSLSNTEVNLVEAHKIAPNPATHKVNIQLKWHGTEGDKTILAYNNIGELVRFYKQNMQKGDNQFVLNIGDLPGGMYHLIIMEKGQEIALSKLIKAQRP